METANANPESEISHRHRDLIPDADHSNRCPASIPDISNQTITAQRKSGFLNLESGFRGEGMPTWIDGRPNPSQDACLPPADCIVDTVDGGSTSTSS
jgi:hypothetical protein